MSPLLATGAVLAFGIGLAVTRGRHLAWPVFLAIAACAFLAG